MSKFLSLERQLVLSLIIGVVLGWQFPELSSNISFLGAIFVRLLKIVALPLIAFSILSAITNLEELGALKKMGLSTFAYYFFTSFMAFVVTFILCFFIDVKVSGVGVAVDINSAPPSFVDAFIPTNIFKMFASGDIIQIILFCLVIGSLSLSLSEKSREFFSGFVQMGQEFCFKAISLLLKIAPLGILSLVSTTIAKLDYSFLPQIGKLCLLLGISLSIHSLVFLPLVAKLIGGFNAYKFLTQMKKPLLMAISTASSNATLPVSLEAIKAKGKVSNKLADFVLPLGATFNMDGSAIFQTLVYLCIASVAGITLGASQYMMLVLIVVFSSVGVAGVPGGALAVTAFMFSFLGIPEEYLGIVILLDRFWDYPITMINVWGDLVGVKVLDSKL